MSTISYAEFMSSPTFWWFGKLRETLTKLGMAIQNKCPGYMFMFLSAFMLAWLLVPLSYETTFISPAGFVETSTDLTHMAFSAGSRTAVILLNSVPVSLPAEPGLLFYTGGYPSYCSLLHSKPRVSLWLLPIRNGIGLSSILHDSLTKWTCRKISSWREWLSAVR